jgi:hypothetical protein
MEEVSIKIADQWYYRGNVSTAWFARGSRSDGSMSGMSERIPEYLWPVFDQLTASQEVAALKKLLKEGK